MIATKTKLWTVNEYHKMIETGILGSQDKVELLEGRIVYMSPQGPPHAATTQLIDKYFQKLFQDRANIRVQLPITLSTSEPEPDIAIVPMDSRQYADRHPSAVEVLLLIEVADTTLDSDREEKSRIYARANIADYWIVDVNSRQIYILRDPVKNNYQSETIVREEGVLTPLAFPEIVIPGSELLLDRTFW